MRTATNVREPRRKFAPARNPCGSVWFDACVVATYETTYASIVAVSACVTNVTRASRCCVRRWRCAAAKKEHGKDKNRFHENLQQGLRADAAPFMHAQHPEVTPLPADMYAE